MHLQYVLLENHVFLQVALVSNIWAAIMNFTYRPYYSFIDACTDSIVFLSHPDPPTSPHIFFFLVCSDGFRTYRTLNHHNNGVYLHDAVNHQVSFVDPWRPEMHSNTMEGTWAHAKSKLQRQLRTSRALIPSYMDGFMWRRNTGPNKFGEIMIAIREFYPV